MFRASGWRKPGAPGATATIDLPASVRWPARLVFRWMASRLPEAPAADPPRPSAAPPEASTPPQRAERFAAPLRYQRLIRHKLPPATLAIPEHPQGSAAVYPEREDDGVVAGARAG